MELTSDEKIAEHDCLWCEYSEYDDEGKFVKCLSEGNNSRRPLLECQLQKPNYNKVK